MMKTKPIEQQLSVVTIRAYKSEINRLHSELMGDAETAIQKAIRIGEMLCGIKDSTPHGQWEDWLSENVDFSQMTACRYMRTAEKSKSNTLLDFETLSDVYKSLQTPKPEPPAPVPAPAPQLPRDEPEAPEPDKDPPHITMPTAGQGGEATPETEAAIGKFLAGQAEKANELAQIQAAEHRPLSPEVENYHEADTYEEIDYACHILGPCRKETFTFLRKNPKEQGAILKAIATLMRDVRDWSPE